MSALFPTTYSTFSATALADYIAASYCWKNVECSLILRGVGDTYLVRHQEDKYVLRIYRNDIRSHPQIIAETDLLFALQDAQVAVSFPVADEKGNCIHAFEAGEGIKYGVLFSYAKGEFVSVLNEQQLQTLGFEMARFHNVSAKLQLNGSRWNFDTETTLQRPLELIQGYFGETPDDLTWLQHAAEKAQKALSEMDSSRFSAGYCHFDFMPKNFHIDKKGQFTFFDFDFFGYGWLVNDIMSFKVSLDLDVQYGKLTAPEAEQSFNVFLTCYKNHKALSDEELAAIPHLTLGFWLFYLGFYTTHDQFTPLLQQPHLGRRVELIRKLMGKNGY